MIKKLLGLRGVRRYIPCNWIGLNWGAAVSDDIFLTENPGRGPDDQGGARVVQLADFDNVQPARIVAELRDYWDSLRQGRAIPARGDVEPRGIRRALDYAFILERIAPGAARFRLAGRHLVDLMGMEVRGMTLASLFVPDSRGQISSLLEQVFTGPETAELTLSSASGFGRTELSGQMLLMPLRSDLGDVSRALGCLVVPGLIGRTPRRFSIDRAEVEAVIAGAPTGPRALPPEATQPSLTMPGMAEPPAAAPLAPPAKILPPEGDTPEARRARFRLV